MQKKTNNQNEENILSSLNMGIGYRPFLISGNQPWTQEDEERAKKEPDQRWAKREEEMQGDADEYVKDLQDIITLIDQEKYLYLIKTKLEESIKFYREYFITNYND